MYWLGGFEIHLTVFVPGQSPPSKYATMVTIVSVGPNLAELFQVTRGRKNQTLGFWRAHSDTISVAGSDGAPDRSYPLGTKLREVTAMQEGKNVGRLLGSSPAATLKTRGFLGRMTTPEGDFLIQEQLSSSYGIC